MGDALINRSTGGRSSGKTHWLWRAVDQNGFVLDVLVQRRRDPRAAQRLMKSLLKSDTASPRVVITDKLRSYAAARVLSDKKPAASRRGSFSP
jgi:transposase-like protein